uniref:Uncharacterized protein n=1 Tax=Aegilops tauschii subsp. strangulata TaxID=200361 RepID=A0A453PHQ5_AEGTS
KSILVLLSAENMYPVSVAHYTWETLFRSLRETTYTASSAQLSCGFPLSHTGKYLTTGVSNHHNNKKKQKKQIRVSRMREKKANKSYAGHHFCVVF